MKLDTVSVDFTDEQKRYLEGFTSGLQISRVGRGFGGAAAKAEAEPSGPDAAHIKAQDRVTASGKKLADQEKFKREQHPFDAYPRLKQQALDNAPPKPEDNFRWRYFGLFYVAPAQDSYMCRLRMPNGILKHWQLAGLADLVERLCGPYAHVTTRANLQVREVLPKHAVELIEGIQDLGLCSRGSGADNIRNVTGTPTAGIDPQELLDTRPHAHEWHYHILNDRSLTGLPRKFNVAFDGAGRIAVLEDTNDIAFAAIEVKDGFGVEPGVWFRLGIGGITGHKDFAKATGIVKPEEATKVADAIVRAFIDTGDRTNRLKARLKYVIDGIGMDKFLVLVEEKLGHALTRVPDKAAAPRPAFDRMAHIGVHAQKQAGLNWIGVALPVGKVTCEQMRGLARIARDLGDGDVRLTVWQNLLISGVRDENVALATAAVEALGLATAASHVRAGLVACTGNAGCKFAASDTKRHAAAVGDWCEGRVAIDQPLNIHLTGCHHSCAQHYISDIGLIAAKVAVGDSDETVEGYHLLTGGGFGPHAEIGQEVFHDLKADDVPQTVERLLKAYLANRSSTDETFLSFARRHDGETLRKLADAQGDSMNQITPPPRMEVIPASAPFSEAQRSWLNGFFAGLLSGDAPAALSAEQGAALLGGAADSDDGAAPWHDQTTAITDRMKLAEGRPLRRRMMAAMAQQDCGQCGYNCQDYSEAIAGKTEARLNLCVPGGKETARMLKALREELDKAPAASTPATTQAVTAPPAAVDLPLGRSRDNPVAATFLSRTLLNKPGSEKETWHIEFDLAAAGLDYVVGDSFGIFASNELGHVDQIIALLGASHTTEVRGRSLRDVLRDEVSLSPAPDSLFELLSYVTGGAQREKARALAQGEDPDGDAATLDVMAALQKFSNVRPHPEAFVEALEPLQPRLYSISSSHNATPGKLSLTVDCVRYVIGKRKRLGLASNFLAERINPGDQLMVYVQKAHAFGLPQDPATPIIMVGPGTGVAPFRAFLQDRRATGAAGKNWLFFGHQRSASDFFYGDELNAMKTSGLLTRLSLAWSRDGAKKFYVQDRMREVGREVWTWLAEGAHVYICGDAKRMAKDVERALVDIVAQFGARTTDEAVLFIADLKKKGRFQQDVY